jgi:hypothetical protein
MMKETKKAKRPANKSIHLIAITPVLYSGR